MPTLDETGILCARRGRVRVVRVESAAARAQLAQPGALEDALSRIIDVSVAETSSP